jgi:hypothetical protein
MKIKGTCLNCGRELLADQAIESGGHCPWCGKAFNKDYTANLVIALREAQAAGNLLEGALEQIAGMELYLELDEETVMDPIRHNLRAARRHKARVLR